MEQSEIVAGPDGEYRVDFCLVDPVMLEVDGYVWHFSPEHQDRDDERRNRCKLAGHRAVRAPTGGSCYRRTGVVWRGSCAKRSVLPGVELQNHLDVGRLRVGRRPATTTAAPGG